MEKLLRVFLNSFLLFLLVGIFASPSLFVFQTRGEVKGEYSSRYFIKSLMGFDDPFIWIGSLEKSSEKEKDLISYTVLPDGQREYGLFKIENPSDKKVTVKFSLSEKKLGNFEFQKTYLKIGEREYPFFQEKDGWSFFKEVFFDFYPYSWVNVYLVVEGSRGLNAPMVNTVSLETEVVRIW